MPTPSLTVVLTAYRRPQNVARVFEALASQDELPVLFVWANDPTALWTLPWRAGLVDRELKAKWEVQSTINAGCSPRWWMAAQATTEFVAVIDDDLYPADPGVLSDVVAWLANNPGCACGVEGKRLIADVSYRDCPNVMPGDANPFAQIIKGRFLAVQTARLAGLPSLLPMFEDDIAVSAHLGGGFVPPVLAGRFKDLPTGAEAVCRRPHHHEERERARRRWCG